MIIGSTEDGRKVHNELFRLYDTYGLPFEDIFEYVHEHQGMPCWLSFYTEARRAGWTHHRIITRLSESLADVYDSHFRDVVIGRLHAIYG